MSSSTSFAFQIKSHTYDFSSWGISSWAIIMAPSCGLNPALSVEIILQLYLQIEVLDKTPPHIVTKGTPSTVEYLQNNQQGIYITPKYLQTSDPDSPNQALEFIITRPPHFGYLENAITGRCTDWLLIINAINYDK